MRLYGEGNYAISDVQEVTVTENFLGMDQSIRGCHKTEDLEECKRREYAQKLNSECHCSKPLLETYLPDSVIFQI